MVLRKIIEIDEEKCDGCGLCVPGCAEGALQIIDGKAKVVADKFCDGLGACIGECPQGALKIVEREAEEFDEEAVEAFLAAQEKKKGEELPVSGCPSSQVHVFNPFTPVDGAPSPDSPSTTGSALSHWPIQIRLIPPHATFLKNADLLVLADCCAVSYANLHKDFIAGKVVMMGCPKFDDVDEYIERFAMIFKTAGIKSITSVYMEVPCCSALPVILKKAMEKTGIIIPHKEVVISRKGSILN